VGGGREGETEGGRVAGGRVRAAVKAEVEKPKAYNIKLLAVITKALDDTTSRLKGADDSENFCQSLLDRRLSPKSARGDSDRSSPTLGKQANIHVVPYRSKAALVDNYFVLQELLVTD
jgi:hypothetical protein